MLGFALLLGATAVLLARSWLEQQARPVVVKEDKIPLTSVVVANATLYFGNRIGRELVKEVAWPADSVPEGAFKTADELLAGTEPKVVLRRIDAGEPILAAKVTGAGQKATLSALVKEDLRAVTIRVNDVVGVAGFVLPGDHVDILLTQNAAPGDSKSAMTDVLLQNVKVLGIDQLADDRQDQPQVVKALTLEVTPEQGQKLILAQQVGTLNLALRNNVDVQEASHTAIGINDLRAAETNKEPGPRPAAKAVSGPRPDGRSLITITRGMKIDDYRVEPEGGLPGYERGPMSHPVSREDGEPAASEQPISLTPTQPAADGQAAARASGPTMPATAARP